MRTGINNKGAEIYSMEGSSTPSAPSPQTAILSHITNAVLSLHTQYARYEQVDAVMYEKFEEEEGR